MTIGDRSGRGPTPPRAPPPRPPPGGPAPLSAPCTPRPLPGGPAAPAPPAPAPSHRHQLPRLSPPARPCTRALTELLGPFTAGTRWPFPSPALSEGQESPPRKDGWDGGGLATAHLEVTWATAVRAGTQDNTGRPTSLGSEAEAACDATAVPGSQRVGAWPWVPGRTLRAGDRPGVFTPTDMHGQGMTRTESAGCPWTRVR